MTTNGTLDTRLSQNLVKEFEIPANKEYDKFNPHKIGGGNAIWITHIPPNVKVWFSTNQNFDNAQRLDYMNRGMRYTEIGSEGITRIYDNFYIFTEGTDENDTIKICVSTYGSEVEPILSSNTNQIDQVDAVGKIGAVDSVKQLYFKPPMLEIKMQGKIKTLKLNGSKGSTQPDIDNIYVMFPLGQNTKNSALGFDNDKWYKIKIKGYFDIGRGGTFLSWNIDTTMYHVANLLLFNMNNDATLTPITDQNVDNFFKADKALWQNEKNDIFNLLGIRYRDTIISGSSTFEQESALGAINSFDNICLKGNFINNFNNFGIVWNFKTSYDDHRYDTTTAVESRVSLLCQFYELETL